MKIMVVNGWLNKQEEDQLDLAMVVMEEDMDMVRQDIQIIILMMIVMVKVVIHHIHIHDFHHLVVVDLVQIDMDHQEVVEVIMVVMV